jgi:exopolysaccharide/PEP-CTERM locus tyrosine autokinase
MSSIEKAIERLEQISPPVKGRDPAAPLALAGKTETAGTQHVSEAKSELQLDFRALARAGYLTPDAMEGELAEQYRLLKRPLVNYANTRDVARLEYGNLIAVTSALAGEGKTFTAFNLAMSIAMERDISILLVDSDLVARSLTHMLQLDDSPGLTDILVDSQVNLREVIVGTNVPKLRLIPAGQINPHPTELLASEQMRVVVSELSARYSDRIILFDTAPLLTTSQAIVLDALVGQVVVVVEEGKTPQHVVQDAVSLLGKNKVVGMILNKCTGSSNRGYSYYGAS